MIIDKIFDNTKDGVPNYSIDLIDGTRLYYRGTVMNPMPQSGDAINYTVINTKTSANGNPYTNIKDVEIASMPNDQQASYQPQQAPQPMPQANTTYTPKPPNGGMNKSDTQRLDIFVTGVVGRSMGSGHFSVNDIEELTKNAVRAFNENLKEL
jgi:predicted carbohydrate-binding protein with CBM5 and CBM33 domain